MKAFQLQRISTVVSLGVLVVACGSDKREFDTLPDAGSGGSAASSGTGSGGGANAGGSGGSGGTNGGSGGTNGGSGGTNGGSGGAGGEAGGSGGAGGDGMGGSAGESGMAGESGVGGSTGGTGGDPGTGGTSGECSGAQMRCHPTTGVPQHCQDGAWQDQTACPFVCTGGVCTGECVPSSRRCDGGTGIPQLCTTAGSWQNQSACGPNEACAGGDCLCTSGLTDCSGTCTNLMTSAQHCGACGHDCLGGECIAGKCQPVEVIGGLTSPSNLVLSSTHVYWMDRANQVGNLKRLPKTGGTAQTLHSGGYPGGLVLVGSELYWGTSNANGQGVIANPQLYRANLDGSNRTEFTATPETVDAVALSGGRLYWNQRDPGQPTLFFSKAIGSTASPSPEGSFNDPISVFTAAGGCIYYRSPAPALIQACSGSTAISRFSGASSVSFLPNGSQDASWLYFGAGGRGLLRLPIVGPTQGATVSDIIAGTDVRGPRVDGNVIYYVDGDTGGAPACTTNWGIYRVGKTPGSTRTTILGPPLDCPNSIAVDQDAIYWLTTGAIWRIAK